MDNNKPKKKPSNASIRGALTRLKKAELTAGEPVVGEFFTTITLLIPNELMAPKKTRKVRLVHKKIKKVVTVEGATKLVHVEVTPPYDFKKDDYDNQD